MLSEEELKEVYNWVDCVQLSRPKKNINRDFSDAVLAAEIVYNYMPDLVELHNYGDVNSLSKKEYNWKTLNRINLSDQEIKALAGAKPEAIETFLLRLKSKLETYQRNGRGGYNEDQDESPKNYNIQIGNTAQRTTTSKSVQRGHEMANAGRNKFKVIENGEEHKNEIIQELRETIEVLFDNQILEAKIAKMESLVRLKDEKLEKLQNKLAAHGHPVV